jgi:hypothetical protein
MFHTLVRTPSPVRRTGLALALTLLGPLSSWAQSDLAPGPAEPLQTIERLDVGRYLASASA